MIRITDDNFYIGFWHFEFPKNPPLTLQRGNFMGCAWRKLREPKGPWTFRYRLRYYDDAKVFDSDDVKNWYEGKNIAATDDADAKRMFDSSMALVAGVHGPVKVYFYELMCDGGHAVIKMASNPPFFMHVRQEPV